MAEIKLTIHGFLKSTKGSDTDTMTLVTGTTPAKSGDYLYALVGLSMNNRQKRFRRYVQALSGYAPRR